MSMSLSYVTAVRNVKPVAVSMNRLMRAVYGVVQRP